MIRRLTLCSPLPCPRIQWLRPAALDFFGSGCIARLPCLSRRPYLFGKKLYPLAPMPVPPLLAFWAKAVSARSHACPPPLPFWEKAVSSLSHACPAAFGFLGKSCICALQPPCVFAVFYAGVFYFCTFCLRRDGICSGRDRISFTTANGAARQCARTKNTLRRPITGAAARLHASCVCSFRFFAVQRERTVLAVEHDLRARLGVFPDDVFCEQRFGMRLDEPL